MSIPALDNDVQSRYMDYSSKYLHRFETKQYRDIDNIDHRSLSVSSSSFP
jgi:hypothetical protein